MEKLDDSKILKCKQTHNVDIPQIPFHQYLLEKMESYGDRVAWVDAVSKIQFSHSELVFSVRKLAAGLQSAGLSKGQYVAIALPNCVEFPISLLAVTLCGGIAALVNPIYTPRELEHVTGIIQPNFWICPPSLVPSLVPLEILGFKPQIVAIDTSNPKESPWHSIMDGGDINAFIPPTFSVLEDVATMPFSSGTTGLPKGVMLTHHNIVTCLCQFKVWCPYNDKDVNLGLLPLFHQYGCLISLTTLAMGALLVNMPKFSFTDMLQAIQDFRVTMVPLVPPIAILLTKHPAVAKYDLSSLKCIISSAAPLSLDVIEEIVSKFKCDVLQGYGLTECTLTTHFTPRGEKRHGSVGILMPFYEGKIVNQKTGHSMGVGGIGEICVRGPMVMKGYRGNAEATSSMIDPDGWLHTGDIGYYDKEGWFFIVDRQKELIKYKGLQVSPSELEHLILTHPDVIDAAVIGVPDEMAGELPRAFVVKRPGSSVTEKEITYFVNDQVAPFKRLRGGVVFTTAIPRLASGKILRRELKALNSKL